MRAASPAARLAGLERANLVAWLSIEECGACAAPANAGLATLQAAVDEVLALPGLSAGGNKCTARSGACTGDLAPPCGSANDTPTGLRAIIESAIESAGAIALRCAKMRDAAQQAIASGAEQGRAVAAARAAIGSPNEDLL